MASLSLIAVLLFFAAFFWADPQTSPFFLKCPFLKLTGIPCPGCGSQRAIHQLLHGHILAAFRYNALVVIFIPYLILGLVLEMAVRRNNHVPAWIDRSRKVLYHGPAVWGILAIVLIFWLIRIISPGIW